LIYDVVGDIDINIYIIYNHSVYKPFTWDQFATFSPCDHMENDIFFKFPMYRDGKKIYKIGTRGGPWVSSLGCKKKICVNLPCDYMASTEWVD